MIIDMPQRKNHTKMNIIINVIMKKMNENNNNKRIYSEGS